MILSITIWQNRYWDGFRSDTRLKLVESIFVRFELSCNRPSGFDCLSPAIFGQVSSLSRDGWILLTGLLRSSATEMRTKELKLIEVAIRVRMSCSGDRTSPLKMDPVADFAARLMDALTSAAVVAGKAWDDPSSERYRIGNPRNWLIPS